MLNTLLRQKWMLVGLGIFVSLFVVIVIDIHRKPTVIQYLNQKDIPANMEQLEAMYPEAPEPENGIFLLSKAARKIRNPRRDEYEKIPFVGGSEVEFGELLTTKQRSALREYIIEHKEVLAMIFEALEYPYVRLTNYRYNYDAFSGATIREISRFLSAITIYAALEDDMALCFKSSKANFAVTDISVYGEDLISGLLRGTALRLAIASIEKSLCYASLPPSMIHTYMELLSNEEKRIVFCYQNNLKTECALDLPGMRFHGRFFEDIKNQFNLSLFLGRIVNEYSQLYFFSERVYIAELEEALKAGNQDIYTALSSSPRYSKDNLLHQSFPDAESIYFALHQIYVDLSSSYTTPALIMANCAAARTALAALLFYYDHGYMPDTLDVLTPEYLETLPRDPFTPDQPIRFRVDGDIARFYSIGRNEVDDGAKDYEDTCKDCDDIVFRLKVPQDNIPLAPPSTGEL